MESKVFTAIILFFLTILTSPATAVPHSHAHTHMRKAITRHRPLLERVEVFADYNSLLNPICRLGLYRNVKGFVGMGDVDMWWSGYPFGTEYDQDRDQTSVENFNNNAPCHEVIDAEEDLKAGIKRIHVQGYCNCLFWYGSGCPKEGDSTGIMVFQENRILQPHEVNKNGQRLMSFKCFKMTGAAVPGPDVGVNPETEGLVQFDNGGAWYNSLDGANHDENPSFWRRLASERGEIDPWTGIGQCIKPDPEGTWKGPMAMRRWRVRNLTCHFFTNGDCTWPPIITDGQKDGKPLAPGDPNWDFSGYRDGNNNWNWVRFSSWENKIGSIRCDAPYVGWRAD
ncbi:hypothetical protein TWF730_003340 [Orbilia blumenaviensis]|uniref:Uncharacterized protein n=1 Tax=Orbilia blumenaviensis TaxID=1796055 RepID=A0AAV9U7E3_9PEZI